MSPKWHPQTDGRTEVMNRMGKNYIRCHCAFLQRDWHKLLTTAEFDYNSVKLYSLNKFLFEVYLKWNIKVLIEILSWTLDESQQSVSQFKQSLQESLWSATFAPLLAEARQAPYNSKKYQPPNYKKRRIISQSQAFHGLLVNGASILVAACTAFWTFQDN